MIPKIVITGGPCAGKTTAMARIITWCQERGFHPLIVPEAATHLLSSGIERSTSHFQEFIWTEILHAEKLRLAAASSYERPVLIYDRGLADSRAYMTDEKFDRLMRKFDLSLTKTRDQYTGVIFLRSAAVGAEMFYTSANNPNRTEGIEEARALDQRTEEAWYGTPHLSIIENHAGQDFESKIHQTLQALARTLGIPEPLEKERKFLLSDFDLSRLPKTAVPINIVQTYLVGVRKNERVRARGQHNSYLYFHTIKEPLTDGITIERERQISRREYDNLLIRSDPGRHPIYKTRHCFAHAGHYCEFDVFHGRQEGLFLLEIEVSDMRDSVTTPPFLGTCEEVTGNPQYSNYELAKLP